ncbi:hypothetical protein SDC9_114605 [bioreactor metagenome]|uniref:Uncharacterized protein n=1 Tax=bioreactor metagenome TaxID=1076179 RepID=A0A645BSU8_9ZZZZ
MLLQIIKDYVDQSLIKEMFIGELLNNYPTGFFLEDQYIRSLVGYRLTLDLNSAKCIHLAPNSFDVGFPSYIHPKYRTIERLLGPLEGFFNSFTFRRDIISKDYNSYYMRPENVITPIVPLANATYEIINNQFYGDLVDFANYYDSSYCCDLDVWLSEIVLQVGSLGRRPVNFPTPSGFSKCKQKSILHPYSYQGWVLLSLREQELLRKSSEMAQRCESLFVLCQVESPNDKAGLFSKKDFRIDRYLYDFEPTSRRDNPISVLTIEDTLEQSEIMFVNPTIIKNLGLSIDSSLHEGFKARDRQGEIIIKMISWKEQYIGIISNGTEVPMLSGVAVVIREEYYKKLLMQYDESALNFVQFTEFPSN